MIGKYFNEIIFPPLSKTEPSVYSNTISKWDSFDFWFATSIRDGVSNLKLIAACPKCDVSIMVKEHLVSEQLMRNDLRNRPGYYITYLRTHCPKCNPNKPIDAATMMRAIG